LTALSTVYLFLAQATQQAVQSATSPVAAPTTQGKPAPGFAETLANPMFPLILGIIVLYFFMYRSKRNQDRQLKEKLDQVKRGDEVMMAGGILGKVVDVRDGRVQVKVDETSNTKIWFTRDAIRRVLTEDKAETAK
jgi:preprotein translocase subunit YajC